MVVEECSVACQASFSSLLIFPTGIKSLLCMYVNGGEGLKGESRQQVSLPPIPSFDPSFWTAFFLVSLPLLDEFLFLQAGDLGVSVEQEQAGNHGANDKLKCVL